MITNTKRCKHRTQIIQYLYLVTLKKEGRSHNSYYQRRESEMNKMNYKERSIELQRIL